MLLCGRLGQPAAVSCLTTESDCAMRRILQRSRSDLWRTRLHQGLGSLGTACSDSRTLSTRVSAGRNYDKLPLATTLKVVAWHTTVYRGGANLLFDKMLRSTACAPGQGLAGSADASPPRAGLWPNMKGPIPSSSTRVPDAVQSKYLAVKLVQIYNGNVAM